MDTFAAGMKHRLSPWLKKYHLFTAAKRLWLGIRCLCLTPVFFTGAAVYMLPDRLLFQKAVRYKAKKLIVISHPDDETLFFSHVLMHGDKDVTVICLTNGYNPVRRKEFYRAVRHYGVNGYIMKLPDQTIFPFLFNDRTVSLIMRRLGRIYHACDRIYTHNAQGEYGHRHHMITSRNVASYFDPSRIMVPETYPEINRAENRLSKDDMDQKRAVFHKIYRSQVDSVERGMAVWYEHEKSVPL